MKKTFLTTVALSTLIASPSIAQTKGNYIGLNVINTLSQSSDKTETPSDDNSFGFGIDYKYAFNFNGFFVAPGIFADYNNAKHSYSNSSGKTDTELAHSYGVKLNIGYDINDKFAVYGTIGHSENRASFAFNNANNEDQTLEAFIYGLGAKYNVNDKISINAAYDLSDFGYSDQVTDTTDKFNSDYSVIKVGVAYNF